MDPDVIHKIRHRSQDDAPLVLGDGPPFYAGPRIDAHFLVTKEDLWTGEIEDVVRVATAEQALITLTDWETRSEGSQVEKMPQS